MSKIISIPTDYKLQMAINKILKDDIILSSLTLKLLRKKLEDFFQCDLIDKKDIIKKLLNKYVDDNIEIIEYNEKIRQEKNDLNLLSSKANDKVDQLNNNVIEDEDLPVNSSTGKGGFKSLVQLSKELSEFFMISKLPRTEVIKRIWMYIKDNNLQNPNNKKEILCDDKLEKIFKRKKIDMFQMTKVLSTMMKSKNQLQVHPDDYDDGHMETGVDCGDDDDDDDDIDSVDDKKIKKEIKQKKEIKKQNKKRKHIPHTTTNNDNDVDDIDNYDVSSSRNTKKSKTQIDPPLATLLDLNPNENRFKVVKRMWEYIREHKLQDPKDKRQINLDSALFNVFKVKKFTMFSMNKYISKHMIDKNG